MKRINIGKFAGGITQILQSLPSLEHLLYGIGTQQIVVNEVQFVGIGTLVAPGPFLRITDSTHTSQIDAGHKICRIVLFYQIRERQIGSIGMVDVTSHNQRERPYPCGPQDIGIGSGFSSTLQRTLMDRTELVHVITLIGTGTGIHKGKHTGYKQGGFMMCHRIRSGKDGTRFTVFSLTVTKKQRV